VLDPPGRRTFAVTFDDAFASVIEHALPILSVLGLPATVFAPTAFMGARRPLDWDGIDHWAGTKYADELTSMDWGDLGELAERGWEIGTHTRTHPRLTQLDEAELTHELEASRFECERQLGKPCPSIAYPYGAVDERVAAAARSAGYLTGACSSSNLRARGPHLWPRIGVYRSDAPWRFGLKLNSGTRLARRSRLWPELHRSHRAVRPAPSAPRRASASS
jgi:peptidoglycan/xylan/chitin deacetylase (PgdA/CDA1 family)